MLIDANKRAVFVATLQNSLDHARASLQRAKALQTAHLIVVFATIMKS